jgi:hypothetical protein
LDFFQIVKELQPPKNWASGRNDQKEMPRRHLLLVSRERRAQAARRPSEIGGGERNRTDDPLLAKQVLSQLSYTPGILGGSGWIRTIDPRLIKTVL